MKSVPVYFSLGSNQGDRRAQIEEALRRLDKAVGRPREALSSLIESKAWGFDGADFLNCVVRYRTARRPETLLRICKRIERAMGRRETLEYDADGRRIYHDRPIDIDILLYGDECVDTPDLKIPHPLMRQRDFILRALEEILPRK
ncbi:MAG: 2-amino-4-hydroxy-6-hydroxymethyldihydropteridine diphosphokinase [Bacteroidales bacterium]|jgi:2-amino-4-hydroxy-6-hydroxymethyldihydropteridine diphosphokinase|nr:2-amino-4-hydroxy-6-hydroxymethyldihydropteridine diphosphokinase [Bacteroidales bacterium]